MKREPPPGGWDKPSWEPSGSLKKEEPETEVEEGGKEQEKEREKPSFVPSGKLAKDTNTYKGVLIKVERGEMGCVESNRPMFSVQ